MKQRIVYIMGVGHSGSTLLQLLLSTHKQMVGLGEISQLIKNIIEKNASLNELPDCSCGNIAKDCEIWGKILDNTPNRKENRIELFSKTISHFQNKFPNKILIDSSKNLDSFKNYYSDVSKLNVDVSVIFLVRDFRSWVLSREKNNKRKNRKDYGLIFNAYKWYYRNERKLQFLKKEKYPYTVICYEDLVLQKTKTLKKITDFLKIENEFLSMEQAVMHDIYGNRMKNDTSRNKQIFYDNKWMKDNKTALLSPFLMLPYALNKKLYSQNP